MRHLLKYVSADFVNADAATFATITDMSFPVVSGHIYTFLAHLFHSANAASNGAQFRFSGVACTFIIAGAREPVVVGVASTTMSSGVVAAVDTAIIAQTDSEATNHPTVIAACFQPSADGTMVLQGTGEDADAAALTVLKGGWARLREVG